MHLLAATVGVFSYGTVANVGPGTTSPYLEATPCVSHRVHKAVACMDCYLLIYLYTCVYI